MESTWELESVIKNLKETSPGPDEIHYAMIKNLPRDTLRWLLEFYNHIWHQGEFPQFWHHSELVPIPKANRNKREAANYRSIFLTSCLCKLMEHMVNKRLKWVIDCNNMVQNF